MSEAMHATRIRPRRLLVTIPALLLGLLLLGLVFRPEILAALSVWNGSTAYNHCFLVLPIAIWLGYDRRHLLAAVPIRPLPWAVLLALPLGCVWLLSERLGFMEGRQFVALGFVELLMLAVLGRRMTRALRAPLLYLIFLVPFGAFLTTPLQDFTTRFVVRGLDLLGIANRSDGHRIEIPEGVFFVAQACAGLRFLIASVAFGVLYAMTLYRSPWRRALFVAVSAVLPVLANGLRALGIVAAGHWVGSAQAAAADHLIYGWLFFSAVIMVLILAGLPFREDAAPDPAAPPGAPPRAPSSALRLLRPAVLLAPLAAAGPLLAADLDAVAASRRVSAPAVLAGCVAADDAAVDAAGWAALSRSGASARAFLCGDGTIRLLTVAFPSRTGASRILAAQRSLTGQDVAEDVATAPLGAAPGWQSVTTTRPQRRSATALWIDGSPVRGGLRSRAMQARRSLIGGGHPVLLAVVEPIDGGPLIPLLRDAGATGLSAGLAAFTTGPS